MDILGISCVSHDAGVALLENGVPTLVLEEERLNREKHTKNFPAQSLAAVLAEPGRSLGQFDAITIPWDVRSLRRTYLGVFLRGLPGSLQLLRDAANTMQPPDRMLWQTQRIRWGLSRQTGQWRLPTIVNVPHHHAHAAFYFVSPFDEASVLVMDGYGDVCSSSAYFGRGNRLERLWHNELLASLGALYTLTTRHLGFEAFEEGTVMALAACGGTTFDAKFRELVILGADGRYDLDWSWLSFDRYGMIEPFTPKFHQVFGPARRKDEPLTDRHRDLAHALQATVEDVILHVARDLHRRSPSRNLVMTGGVALNCVANARIKRDTPYEHVWVPPCASDTGVPWEVRCGTTTLRSASRAPAACRTRFSAPLTPTTRSSGRCRLRGSIIRDCRKKSWLPGLPETSPKTALSAGFRAGSRSARGRWATARSWPHRSNSPSKR